MKNRGFTWLELLVVMALIGILISILLPSSPKRYYTPRPNCANNLRQWSLVLKMYANESEGNRYPHLQIDYGVPYQEADDGQLMYSKSGPDSSQIYPEYLTDVSIGYCPDDTTKTNYVNYTVASVTFPVNNTLSENKHNWCTDLEVCATEKVQFTRKNNIGAVFGYTYMPKLIQSDWIVDPDDNAALAKLYSASNTFLNRNDDITLDLTGVGTSDKAWNKKVTLRHLHEGSEIFMAHDTNPLKIAQSVIPVMWDPVITNGLGGGYFNHIPGGSNVLYMDGHVEFVKYPAPHIQSTWPLSQVSVDKLFPEESW